MTTSDNVLDDENAHVQELKRLFLSSNVDENQCLDTSGLLTLCEKLKLSDFSKEIAERVLCGGQVVDFYNFKERFVSFLPEIIDVSSGTVDPLVSKVQRSVVSLGFGNAQRLTRYQTRLMCENTDELEQLSVVDINSLFERADSQSAGLVSIQQFLAQYRLQKRLSAEVHFIADSYVPSVNLFESLDPTNSGTIDSHDLMESWNKAGLRIDEGLSVLKDSGQPMSGSINAVYISAYLERELSQYVEQSPVAVKASIFTLHNCIDHLRYSLRESEARAEHIHKQLQLANQRRTLLIEELEHNQLSIEQGYDKRLRETEDRYRARLIQMEDKFRIDKREIQNEMEQVEEELSRTRQQEVSTRNKILLLERQNARLNEETRDQSDTIAQLEQLNRQLRLELSKVMQPRPVEDNTQLLMWKQKVDLLVAHNKRLREKIQDITVSQKKRQKGASDGEALTSKWSPAFRSQMMLIRKRRAIKGDTLSEMDSEPEGIFVRHKRRRRLKRKERKGRHERIAARLLVQDSDDSAATTSSRREQALLTQRIEEQLTKLREDHKKELQHVKQAAGKTLADSLNDQEKQLNLQFDRERRNFELRITNEKNVLERGFAEEKMKLMSRLQEEFDAEVKRLAAIVNQPQPDAAMMEQKRKIKMLESSLEGQKNGYEKRLMDMKEKYRTAQRAINPPYQIDRNAPNFISLIEQYRNKESSSKNNLHTYTSSRSSLGVEKRPSSSVQSFQRSLSSFSSRCEKCEQTEIGLRELFHTMADDQSFTESGIEDIGSSAGSHSDDKVVLRREVRKLKGRLDAAKDKVNELLVLSMNIGGAIRWKGVEKGTAESGSWSRNSTRWSEVTRTIERLESKNLIVEARLAESQSLIKNVVEQYKKQLDETARLGRILKDVYAHPISTEHLDKTKV